MFAVDREAVLPLPEEAFEVESVEVLRMWLSRELASAPEWLRSAARALTPIERRALSRSEIGLIAEAAKARLHLRALDRDRAVLSSALQDDLLLLDRRLRAAAKLESDEDVLAQLGQIRVALHPYLVKRIQRRERIAFVGYR